MKEYRIKVTVRNNLLLLAIEAMGYKTQSEFARYCGLPVSCVNDYVAMRLTPISDKTGEFRESAKLLMESLGASPSDLWTEKQLTLRLDYNTSTINVSESVIAGYMAQDAMQSIGYLDVAETYEVETMEKALSNTVSDILWSLPERTRLAVEQVVMQGRALQSVGEEMGVTKERVRQIVNKGIRLVRRQPRIGELREFL
jgi:DNA-directed RNA polymerase specialized sigma subunit